VFLAAGSRALTPFDSVIRLFQISVSSSVLALILSETALVFACYLAAAYLTLTFAPDVFLFEAGGLLRIALVSTIIVLGLYFSDLYERFRVRSRIALLQQYCLVLGVAFLSQALLSYGRWDVVLPKWMMVYGSMGVLLTVPAWRIFFAEAMARSVGAQRALFLGNSQTAGELAAALADRPELGLLAIGYLADSDASNLAGISRLGALADLPEVVETVRPSRVIVGVPHDKVPINQLLELNFKGVQVETAASLYEAIFGRVSTRDLDPAELAFNTRLRAGNGSLILQSIYSWVVGLIGLLVAAPLMLLVAFAVRITSPGPVLYRQIRVGRNGVTFSIYKFRSMYQDAEARTGAVWASKNDPRITPLGYWLRKMRLDELPQLFNVVRGDMCIVGPRPERPEFVKMLEEQIPCYRQRLTVKPGITGWAQVNYKYGDTIADAIAKLEYDLYYIKNLALSLDFYIIFHTIKTVLLGRGAQ
jgi:exopolysaccharide biosynthesis polyprenyl glycosylphosphotransferase